MNRGASRQRIFADDNDSKDSLNLLGETSDKFTIQIHAYCLLDNHYHLLIHTPQGNISRSMRHLNGIYTQRCNLGEELKRIKNTETYVAYFISKEIFEILSEGETKTVGAGTWVGFPPQTEYEVHFMDKGSELLWVYEPTKAG
jgi:REP element-mobilizing transposase RayT